MTRVLVHRRAAHAPAHVLFHIYGWQCLTITQESYRPLFIGIGLKSMSAGTSATIDPDLRWAGISAVPR